MIDKPCWFAQSILGFSLPLPMLMIKFGNFVVKLIPAQQEKLPNKIIPWIAFKVNPKEK